MPSSCVIYDFDGVIADTETLHLAAYNATFAAAANDLGRTLEVPRQAYFSRYIVYGNREGFLHMLRDAGLPHDTPLLAKLCAIKEGLFAEQLGAFAEPMPGVRRMLAWLEERGIPRAICSGAQRREIEHLLQAFGLRAHFEIIVAIEDVRAGKPDPEGYEMAFDRLNNIYDGALHKQSSLVIEDSAGGCAAGRAAGIPVLAVATSLPLEEVRRCADHAVRDLSELDLKEVSQWLALKDG